MAFGYDFRVNASKPSSPGFFSACVVLGLVGTAACAPSDVPAVAPENAADALAASTEAPPVATVRDESFEYLEEVASDRSLDFARRHNDVSEGDLGARAGFKALEERLFAIYTSKEKIPSPSVRGKHVRNFWTDADHPRGLWRETTLAEYKKASPKWETLLDVDALGKAEGASFVFHGATCLYPRYTRCLVELSPGGGDAAIVREFDTEKRSFVTGGFVVPEAKSQVAWKDENTLYVATDFGAGSLTKSGYPRTVREWTRGTPLPSATSLFEIGVDDIETGCSREWDHGFVRDLCERVIDFEHKEVVLLDKGKRVTIDKPSDAEAGTWSDQLLLRLRSDWSVGGATFAKGSLLITSLPDFLAGKRQFQVLFAPTAQSSLASWTGTKHHLLVTAMRDVRSEITVFSRSKKGTWSGAPLDEKAGAMRVSAFDANESDDAWLWLEDYTTPSSLLTWNVARGKRERVKQNPAFFDAKGLEVTQHFVTSKDGTRVPYFEVAAKGRSAPGPALLYAYGGFEISLSPSYIPGYGAGWVERGGTYVVANLRGGGEYGPAWHEAAMKHKRQNAYDDLAAVAEDLVRRQVTTASMLGVQGGSNGGLLTSVMLTQRPELFGAVVSMVPLADMKRYHRLLAGASWMSEYGDPDNADDWAALAKFSPFQNVRPGLAYPPALYTSSTKDDRVHPAHARKMVAKLEAYGYKPMYYENIEGGHGGAADAKQRAHRDALIITFLASHLGLR